MQLPYKTYGVLTAGELRNKLKGVSNDTPVYVVVDKSDDNFDENGILKVVHPIESVEVKLGNMPWDKAMNTIVDHIKDKLK